MKLKEAGGLVYNNKMQKLRKLNIFQIYTKLPFILYKSTYLIPQRPFPNSLIQPLASDLAEFPPAKLLDSLIETSGDKIVEKSTQNGSSAKKKQPNEYETLLSDYICSYILPLHKAQRGTVALNLYTRQKFNDSTTTSEGLDRIGKKQISQRFSALPIEERWPYLQRAESIIAANSMRFQAYQKLFEIPKAKALRPLDLYVKQRQADKQQQKDNELSVSQKKRFAELSIQLKQQDKRTLRTFLQEYSLTIPQFDIIKEICEKVSKQCQLQKEYKNGTRQYEKLLKDGKSSRAKIVKKDNQKVAEDIKKLSAFTANLPKKQLQVYYQLISLSSNPHFKRQQFLQLCKQLHHQKALQAEKAKEIKPQQIKPQTILIENPLFYIGKITNQPEKPILNEKISTQFQSPSNAEQTLTHQAQPIEMALQQVKEVEFNEDDPCIDQNQQETQLKDENLNDMEIIQDDYQVLKLNRLIEKAGKPKIPAKKYVY